MGQVNITQNTLEEKSGKEDWWELKEKIDENLEQEVVGKIKITTHYKVCKLLSFQQPNSKIL